MDSFIWNLKILYKWQLFLPFLVIMWQLESNNQIRIIHERGIFVKQKNFVETCCECQKGQTKTIFVKQVWTWSTWWVELNDSNLSTQWNLNGKTTSP